MTDKTGMASYAGAGIAAVTGAITVQEWAVLISLAMGVATFAVNWHYKRRDSQAKREADLAKKRYYRRRTDDTAE